MTPRANPLNPRALVQSLETLTVEILNAAWRQCVEADIKMGVFAPCCSAVSTPTLSALAVEQLERIMFYVERGERKPGVSWIEVLAP